MRRSQPWKVLKEEHFNGLISIIYSVDHVHPSSSCTCNIPCVLLSVSEKADLQIHLVLSYVFSACIFSFLQEKTDIRLSA